MKQRTSHDLFGDLLSTLKREGTVVTYASQGDVFTAEVLCRADATAPPSTHEVSFALVEDDTDAAVMIIAWVGAAGQHHERALRLNASLSYGRIAVVDHQDQAMYAVVYHHPLSEIIPSELLHAAREVAVQSEALRHELDLP